MTNPAPMYSDDAEAAILGGIMLRPSVLATLDLLVEDFHSPRHQVVYQAMRNLEATSRAIDGLTVLDELVRLEKSEAVGGLAFIGDLQLRVPTAENVMAYAATVVRYAQRRSAIRSLSDLVHRLQRVDDADGEDCILEAIGSLQRIDLREPDPTVVIGDSMRRELGLIHRDTDDKLAGHPTGNIPTGIGLLDEFTGGLPVGVVTLLLGETGHGKSTVAMQFMRGAMAGCNDRPLCFSYEDGHRSFAQRALAQESRVPTQVIVRRDFRGWQAQDLAERGAAAISKRRERIAAWRGQSCEELCRTVKRLRGRGCEKGAASIGRLVVVDYLQAIPRRRGAPANEAIGENAAMLEDLAAREQIAVVAVSQVNDEPQRRDNHRPQGRDVAGSRDPLKGCKLCLGLYRPAEYDKGADHLAGEIHVLKNNQGPTTNNGQFIAIKLDLATHSIRDSDEPSARDQQRMGV